LAGKSFVPLLDEPKRQWKKHAISQFPNPALREWAANPLSSGMRQTFFGPLIEEVERKIIKQQGKSWNRDLFENHLMGYSLRTDRHRLVVWLDYREIEAEPLYLELYDHAKDPEETENVAKKFPQKTEALLKRLRKSGIGKGVRK
jgi:iduronate 2-sulfatase